MGSRRNHQARSGIRSKRDGRRRVKADLLALAGRNMLFDFYINYTSRFKCYQNVTSDSLSSRDPIIDRLRRVLLHIPSWQACQPAIMQASYLFNYEIKQWSLLMLAYWHNPATVPTHARKGSFLLHTLDTGRWTLHCCSTLDAGCGCWTEHWTLHFC